MYKEYFGFKFPPFSIAPDPHYLYMSDQHREALAHLLYGIKGDGGFVLLTGEVGTGKTTVCRCILEQLPEKTDIAMVLNPKVSVQELLATICEEFGIETETGNASTKFLIDYLNRYLLDAHARGRHCILIIDEAQNLSTEVLEQLRLLTNLETNERKLLQIILIGQPELKELLEHPELRQLAQRVTARYHLNPLSKKELGAYIVHRLAVAGAPRQVCRELFPAKVLNKIYAQTEGVPRLINIICDRALLGAYVQGLERVDKATIKQAAREISGEGNKRPAGFFAMPSGWIFSGLIFLLCLSLGGFYYFNLHNKKNALQIEDSHAAIALENTSRAVRSEIQTPAAPEATVINNAALVDSPPKKPETVPLKWPESIPLSKSNLLAYEALFRAWDIPFNADQNNSPCQSAPAENLRCLHLQGSLDSLIHLNRPAVLTLYTDTGEEYSATIFAIDEETATFSIGGETYTVQQSEIWSHWYGDYTLLWSTPPGYVESLRPGDEGPAVEWLSQKIAAISGESAEKNVVSIYDENLVNQVKKFQFAMHLVPDGLVGPQTIIHLNSAAGTQVPKLVKSGGTR